MKRTEKHNGSVVWKAVCVPGAIATLLLLIVFGLPSVARADGPWYVDPDGSDGNDCLTWETACRTIASAVNRAGSGDTILLATGVFTRGATITKTLTLHGAGPDRTIVDAQSSGRVFTKPVAAP